MERRSVAIQHLVVGRLIAYAANRHWLAVLLPAGALPCPIRPAWACKRVSRCIYELLLLRCRPIPLLICCPDSA